MPLPPSAADWTRIKRIRQSTAYANTIAANKDVINTVTAANPFHPETQQSRVVGSSKTRREASKWVDFVASQNESFVQKSVNYQYSAPSAFTGTRFVVTNLCDCVTTTLAPKTTGCIKCNYM